MMIWDIGKVVILAVAVFVVGHVALLVFNSLWTCTCAEGEVHWFENDGTVVVDQFDILYSPAPRQLDFLAWPAWALISMIILSTNHLRKNREAATDVFAILVCATISGAILGGFLGNREATFYFALAIVLFIGLIAGVFGRLRHGWDLSAIFGIAGVSAASLGFWPVKGIWYGIALSVASLVPSLFIAALISFSRSHQADPDSQTDDSDS